MGWTWLIEPSSSRGFMWWQPLQCLSFCGFSTSGDHQLLELCRGGGFAGQQTSWVPLLLGKGCWHKRGVPSRGGGGSTKTYIWTRLSKCPWLGWLSWGAASPCWADCCTHRYSCIRVDSILPAAAMSLNQQERSLVWDKNHQCHLAGRMLELCWLWGRAWKSGRNAVLPKCAVL